ncbi:hypothetical protein BsWGS_23726 [Bradybaena similaris]
MCSRMLKVHQTNQTYFLYELPEKYISDILQNTSFITEITKTCLNFTSYSPCCVMLVILSVHSCLLYMISASSSYPITRTPSLKGVIMEESVISQPPVSNTHRCGNATTCLQKHTQVWKYYNLSASHTSVEILQPVSNTHKFGNTTSCPQQHSHVWKYYILSATHTILEILHPALSNTHMCGNTTSCPQQHTRVEILHPAHSVILFQDSLSACHPVLLPPSVS